MRRPVSVAATAGHGLAVDQDATLIMAEEAGPELVLPDSRCALVADDDPAILELMDQFLTSQGWEVRTALTLKEAVDALDSSVHVAFLDVHMPEANSIEILDRLHQRSPGTRLISFTGDQNAQLGVEAFRRGASDFLRKPIQFDQVLAAANAAFGRGDRARENSARAFSNPALPDGGH